MTLTENYTDASPLRLPRAPEPVAPPSFPWVASAAPVLGALVIWAITRSPYTLLFAVLGPLIAIGTLVDGRIGTRRRRRRSDEEFSRAIANSAAAVDRRLEVERRGRCAEHPSAASRAARSPRDPELWRGPADRFLVRVGLGTAASGVRWETSSADLDERSEIAELRSRARRLHDVPIVVDTALGIGLCGPPFVVAAAARALTAQLAHSLPPDLAAFSIPDGSSFDPFAALPHAVERGRPHQIVVTTADRPPVVIALAAREDSLSSLCRVVIELRSGRSARIVRDPTGLRGRELVIDTLSADESARCVEVLRAAASIRGVEPPGGTAVALPLSKLLSVSAASDRATLACAFATSSHGEPVRLDLVADGPHAVIGGTTGSGKSELLLSWLLALAASKSPDTLTFLLVDFKGGASFTGLETLPHVVGVVTDLDERGALRALESLRAEVRYRERMLAASAARSIDELPPEVVLPRLVIVVDEYAAVIDGSPDLHGLFGDLAARGRSLGIHLVLCTQRPAGVVRDAVLANAPLRISLRVTNAADSTALIGTSDAAALPARPPGRALASIAGSPPIALHVARSSPADLAAVIDRTATPSTPPRRPWCPELPAMVRLDPLVPGTPGIPFGLLDLPSEQRQATAVWQPAREGSLLVLGGAVSGRSTVLGTLAAGASIAQSEWRVVVVPSAVDAAWDVLTAAERDLRNGGDSHQLILIDDVDGLLARLGPEHSAALADTIVALLRDGGPTRRLALTARRITAAIQPIAALCDARLILGHSNQQDYVLAGGSSAKWSRQRRPGAGEWLGHAVQVAITEVLPAAVSHQPPLNGIADLLGVAIVSPRWRTTADLLSAHGFGRPIEIGADGARGDSVAILGAERPMFVGDPDTWLASWAPLASAKRTVPLLLDGCSVQQFRAVTGLRDLPPPLTPGTAWLVATDAAVTRIRLRP